ncbi:hypothetical protein PPYR_04110 [Photinus pyralis]|uniref:DUF4200 domain-containing protein n=1 Tax=Photinus pyralis TaxID=7054 RepID=A0A5N4AX52_PHOPY|nr:cilia- and flagella-associated protein 100-like [Photinus pyralis]KAB0801924.1 hypothetical protein PPYR_04110 [Photinus pyralis]
MSSVGVECDNNVPRKKPVVFTRRSGQKVKEPKLKPPSALERVFGKPNKPRDRYFTAGVKINESNNIGINAETLPFSYPKDLDEFSYRLTSKSWRQSRIKQENERKYNERHKIDLLNRLYVKEPEVKSMKTILDVDPQFYTLTAGRPVGRKFNRRDYIEDINNVLRTKIAIGYREDDIMVVDENHASEKKILNEVSREFQKYLNTFEEFLFNDHSASMDLLKESEQIESEASEKVETLQKLTKGYGSLKSTVCNLEEKWRNCKTYQKFLYLVSPMDWRKEHDFYLTQETANDRRPAGEVQSLSNLISQFVEDVQTQEKPSLFFSEPNQLLKVFAFIELQNLNTLLHSEELAVPLEQVKEAVKYIEDSFSTEGASLQEIIDNLEREIIWEEDRATRLEELALELINGDFKELISNEEAINLYVFVEDVYEDRLGLNDSKLTMKEMMKIIETGYRDYLLHLDRLPDDLVRKAEATCRRNERKKVLLAENAARKVVQVERLTKHLARLLDPPRIRTARSLKSRSPRVEDKEKPKPPPRPMTADQIDHLEFFTDSCFHSDDPKLFGVRVHKNDAH